MKYILLLFIYFVLFSCAYGNNSFIRPVYDTTILLTWKEKGIHYRVEILIVGAADSNGVVPGKVTESYIHFKKIEFQGERQIVISEVKDTCNPQVKQLIFYSNHLALTDCDNNGNQEVVLMYEFVGDGYDPRTIRYVLIDKKIVYCSDILFAYNEEDMRYELKTPISKFLKSLPGRYKNCHSLHYKTFDLDQR